MIQHIRILIRRDLPNLVFLEREEELKETNRAIIRSLTPANTGELSICKRLNPTVFQ